MSNNPYKIELGIGLNDTDFKNLQTKIKGLEDEVKINLNIKDADNKIESLRSSLKNLEKDSPDIFNINTKSLTDSLETVKKAVVDIKEVFGSLDNKLNTRDLVTSVNQIATALGKAESESDSLVKSLSALSKKDFNINFGLNMGKSVSQMSSEQGDIKRNAITQLKQQAKALEDYLGEYYKVTQKQEGVVKLTQGTSVFSAFWEMSPNIGNTKISLKQQVATYKEYIDLIQEAARIKGVDLSSVTSGFSKTTSDIVEETNKAVNGVEELKQSFKGLFGSGIDSEVLTGISQDLKEIKQAFETLSSIGTIDGLTASFKELSEVLEKLTANITAVKQNLDGIGNVGASAGQSSGVDNLENGLKQVENAAESAKQAVKQVDDAADNVGSDAGVENLSQDLKEVKTDAGQAADAIKKTANEAKNISIDINDGNIDDVKNALRSMNIDDSGIEEATKELNELSVVARNVSATFKNGQLIKVEVKGIETAEDGLERIVTLTRSLKKDGSWSSSTKFSQPFNEGIEAAKRLKKEVETIEDIKLDIKLGNYLDDVEKMHTSFDKLSSASTELRNQVEAVDNAYEAMLKAASANTGDEVADRQRLIQAEKAYAEALEKTSNAIKQQAREEKALADAKKLAQDKESLKLDTQKWLNENTRAAQEYGEKLKSLLALLDKVDNQKGFDEVARSIKNVKKEADAMGKTGLTVWDRLKAKAKEYASYLSAAELFMYAEQALTSMFEQIKLIDSAMTELKKVTDETDASYNRFLTDAASRAKKLGTTIDGLISSTADFARLGYGFEDAQELAEVANIYAVVGDEIDGVEGATESLISTLAAFKDETSGIADADFAMDIIDKFNEVKFDAS